MKHKLFLTTFTVIAFSGLNAFSADTTPTNQNKVSVIQVTPSGTTVSENPVTNEDGKIVISNPAAGADGVITLINSDHGIVLSTGKAATQDAVKPLVTSGSRPKNTPIPSDAPPAAPPDNSISEQKK